MTPAPAYVPFEPITIPDIHTRIDTTPLNGRGVTEWLYAWKQLAREGWSVTILHDVNGHRLIGLGCRGGIHVTLKHEPPLHTRMLLQTLRATYSVDPAAPDRCCHPYAE